MSPEHVCCVCGVTADGHPWVLLSRYAFSGGDECGRTMSEHDGWNCDADDPDEHVLAGDLLHWPVCATMYLDAAIAEQTVAARSVQ